MTRRNVSVVFAALAVAAVVLWCWPKDDKSTVAALVGTWRAVDPHNAALHERVEGVDVEQVVFTADGRLTYVLETRSTSASSKREPWEWKVKKGRMLIRYIGEGGTQEWLGPIRFSLSGETLSFRKKGVPVKEFTRVSGSAVLSAAASRPTPVVRASGTTSAQSKPAKP